MAVNQGYGYKKQFDSDCKPIGNMIFLWLFGRIHTAEVAHILPL